MSDSFANLLENVSKKIKRTFLSVKHRLAFSADLKVQNRQPGLLCLSGCCALLLMSCGGDEIDVPVPDVPDTPPEVPPVEPTPPELTLCELPIVVDWDSFGYVPTDMTLLIYSEGSATPISQTVNATDTVKVDLPVGSYDVILYNGKAADFTTIGFRDMESYPLAELYTLKMPEQNDSLTIAYQPEHIGVARLADYVVAEEMLTKADKPLIQLQPTTVEITTALQIHIEGIDRLEKVTGIISGLAETYHIATGKTGEEQVAHLLEEWTIVPDATDPTIGWIKTQYTSFGLPTWEQPLTDEDIQLHLSFQLAEPDTVLYATFLIGEILQLPGSETEIAIAESIDLKPLPAPENPDNGEEEEGDDEDDENDTPPYIPPYYPPYNPPVSPGSPGFNPGVNEWNNEGGNNGFTPNIPPAINTPGVNKWQTGENQEIAPLTPPLSPIVNPWKEGSETTKWEETGTETEN